MAAVTVAALVGAYASSGLSLALLKPRRLDELGAGLSHGVESLASVQMPYRGADPWPSLTLQLLGAALCVCAALLAFWPRRSGARGYQFLALALLLVLVAAPVVSIGGTRPVVLGLVLTALTVCFLWLERLPLRPGLGIAAMAALALAGALPLASAANGEQPWFDYKAFAESLGPDDPVQFNWNHTYGDITWPRDGAEVLRVDTRRPSYWKVANLDDFDGEAWVDDGTAKVGASTPAFDLPDDWRSHAAWRDTLRVTLRRIETDTVIGAGTTLAVRDTSRTVVPGDDPGLWSSTTTFRGGDSYSVQAYTPRPDAEQLAEASTGDDPRQAAELHMTVPTEVTLPRAVRGESDAASETGQASELRSLRLRADVRFSPFSPLGRDQHPYAAFQTLVRDNDGATALRRSPYAGTWRLAKRLMRESRTPYEYVTNVDRYLHDGFRYDETPDPVSSGRATLDGFLLETKSGYCQHFSGAMALLLRMGGVPARVVTGFSPGGYSERKHAWIVRDTDAHSWVEAWFDGLGWVTFDPTPSATPARSQIAALDRPDEDDDSGGTPAGGDSGGSAPRTGGVRAGPARQPRGPDHRRLGIRRGGRGRRRLVVVRGGRRGAALARRLGRAARPPPEHGPGGGAGPRDRRAGGGAAADRRPAGIGEHHALPARAAGRPVARRGRLPARAAERALRAERGAADVARAAGAAARAGPGAGCAREAAGAVRAAAVACVGSNFNCGIEGSEAPARVAGFVAAWWRIRNRAATLRCVAADCRYAGVSRNAPLCCVLTSLCAVEPQRIPPRHSDPPFNAAVEVRAAAGSQPASAARRDSCRISDRIRSSRGSADVSTCVIAAATAGWRSAISACMRCATAR